MQKEINNVYSEQKDKTAAKSLRYAVLLVAAVLLVGLGYGLGKGNISFNGVTKKVAVSTTQSKINYSQLDEVYSALKDNFDGTVDNAKLLEGAKQGLASASGDQYTEYFNPSAAKEFNGSLQGEFSGIGAELGKEDKAVTVISPISGFPADKAGLRPKDVIAEIDGKSAYDITIGDAVKRIRGESGTSVKLRIIRGGSQDLTLDIIRATIKIPSVEYKVREDGLGHLKISRFADDTASLSRKAAEEFKAKNVKGVLLDLRGDPGGELGAAVSVASLWVKPGDTVLQEKRGTVVQKTYKAQGDNILGTTPTVALINEGSASASEILAGALHDHNLAKLVGKKSYGKGSVQVLNKLKDGGLLKVTIARWYTPNDKNIDKQGIEPDTVVEKTDEDFKQNRDPQLDKAIEQLK